MKASRCSVNTLRFLSIVGRNIALLSCVLVLPFGGCFAENDKRSDSAWLPIVKPIAIDHMRLKADAKSDWHFVIGNRVSLRAPIISSDIHVGDLEVIKGENRSLVFLGSAPTTEGEPLLFDNAVNNIHDGSVPAFLKEDPLAVLEHIYGFDSQDNPHQGAYREFVHSTATFFRHRDVQNFIVVDNDDSPYRVILFQGEKADMAFVICEVYTKLGRGLAFIRFTSAPDDVEWIFDSVASINALK